MPTRRRSGAPWVPVAVGGGFTLFAALFLLIGILVPGSPGFRLAFIGLPLVFMVVGVSAMVKGVRGMIARAAFEVAELTPTTDAVALGGTARVDLELSPKREIKVKGGKLTFTTEEEAIYSAGTDRRTYREVVFTWSTPLNLPDTISGSFRRELRIPIPKEIPPTFKGSYNRLTSACEVKVDFEGLPSLELGEEIVVAPEVVDERPV